MTLLHLNALRQTAPRFRRAMIFTLLLFVVCYLLLLALGCAFSNRLIFPIHRQTYVDSPSILKLKTSDGLRISAIHIRNPQARFTILFSHGNGEDIGDNQSFFAMLREKGFAVFAYDYHGYGTSEGVPTDKNTYRDIDAAYDYLVKNLRVPPECILVHGRSVGTGPSLYLASRQPVGGLILESAFLSAYRVLTRYPLLPFDKFPNAARIGQVRCPVLVIHARDDQIIPFWHGAKLYARANDPKMHLWVETGGHNALLQGAGEDYWQALRSFAGMVGGNDGIVSTEKQRAPQ